MSDFDEWWHETGSGVTVSQGADHEEHAKRVAEMSWRAALISEVEPVAFMCQGNIYNMDDIDEHCTAVHKPLFTAEALAAAVLAERERAAKVCEARAITNDTPGALYARDCAEAIREGKKP